MPTEYRILGLMSGTSLDGIDMAHCSFSKGREWEFVIRETETVPYPPEWKRRLEEGVFLEESELRKLDEDYTAYLAGEVAAFTSRHAISGLDAVCSHGHTILHQPEKEVTLQIGNLPQLAGLLKQTVICDFRSADVALGGQGAPLVPVGDELLFGQYNHCLNLGGFANVSTPENGVRKAWDICPVNCVLNPLAERLGLPYDEGGAKAAAGRLIPELLEQLNALSFYAQKPPKSLGIEWVLQNIFPLFDEKTHKTEDLLRTFTEHCAVQLAVGFPEGASVLITGGGAYNDFLLKRMRFHKKILIEIPDKNLIEYKEALVFGLLGVLRLRGEVNCLKSVTGARKNHVSGRIYLPGKKK